MPGGVIGTEVQVYNLVSRQWQPRVVKEKIALPTFLYSTKLK